MDWIQDLLTNDALICGFFAWLVSQALKYITEGCRSHEWRPARFFNAGGMPSAHTAAVVAMTCMVGIREGLKSSLFAVCTVFSIIVMYDATGVRRETGKQGSVLNMLLSLTKPEDPKAQELNMKERIGHTPLEVAMGALTGAVCTGAYVAVRGF